MTQRSPRCRRSPLLAAAVALLSGAAAATDAAPAGAPAPRAVAPAASAAAAPSKAAPARTGEVPGEFPLPPADAADSAQDPDDPDAQRSIDQSAAELEAVRAAEQKAGLLAPAPGKGPLDGIGLGLGPLDPLARDLDAALGSSLGGAPAADPVPAAGTAVSLPELTGISAEELRSKYDIPVELNDAVVAYIRFFQHDARDHFSKWLGRATRWQPVLRPILETNGVPLDLVFLSMIESGYNPYAYSFAKAAGLWQFVVGTSRRYGLTTDFWVDERRDPIRSTEAAARYLADLRERFHGDWYLAWAGYNAGEGKIEKAIRREATVDFWRMMSKGRTLRAETKHYVPKLIAAALISKHPERFGFHVEPEGPFDFDEAEVPQATSLAALARAAGTTVEELRALNPALRRFCTPPGGWTVRLPKGTRDAFLAAWAQLGPQERLSFAQHKIEKGDSLAKLARAYGVGEQAILKTNGLTSHKQAKVGRVLVIPLQGTRGLAAGEQLEERRGRNPPRTQQGPSRARTATAAPSSAYAQVQKAREQALAQGRPDPAEQAAAREAQAAAAEAKRRAEQQRARAASLAARASGAARPGTYVVQPGDNLWSIAARLGTTVDELKRVNKMSTRDARALMPGQTLSTGG